MNKRYYHPNQSIKVHGFEIIVSTSGTAYNRTIEGDRKLDSLWQPKINTLQVVLLNDKTVMLRPTKGGLEIREQ